MSSALLIALANHLWQSTLFAVLMGVLTLLARHHSARVRYLLWLAASAKFLVPCALLTAVGAQIPLSRVPAHAAQQWSAWIAGQITASLVPLGAGAPVSAPSGGSGDGVMTALLILWALGTLAVAARWLARWRDVRRMLRGSAESDVRFVIPVRSSTAQVEPVVVGILHPVLVLPQGIDGYLAPEQLRAVLAHERCHVRWRDNLACALHMLVEALFWFHPLIWWLGARLIEERERACDEQVLADGHAGETYAEGILSVCERFLQSRLACAAGVGGANLRARIEGIMKNRLIKKLSGGRRLTIAAVICTAIAAPVAIGALTAPQAAAEPAAATTGAPAYQNLSIRIVPWDKDRSWFSWGADGRLQVKSFPLRSLIAIAYGVQALQVVGRDWSREPVYDITADIPLPAQIGESSTPLQQLLAQRFGLAVRLERKQIDGYVLKLGTAALSPGSAEERIYVRPGGIEGTNLPLSYLTGSLWSLLQVPVIDQTGLGQQGFDYKVSWPAPLAIDPTGTPSAGAVIDPQMIAKALKEQLGLHLESAPVTVDLVRVVALKPPAEVTTSP